MAPRIKESPVEKLRLKIKAYDSKLIDNSVRQIIDTAKRYDAKIIGPIPLPTEIHKYTVNRSTFVHKNAREQFELRIHKRLLDIVGFGQNMIEALSKLNLAAGVEIEIKII